MGRIQKTDLVGRLGRIGDLRWNCRMLGESPSSIDVRSVDSFEKATRRSRDECHVWAYKDLVSAILATRQSVRRTAHLREIIVAHTVRIAGREEDITKGVYNRGVRPFGWGRATLALSVSIDHIYLPSSTD